MGSLVGGCGLVLLRGGGITEAISVLGGLAGGR